MEGDADNTISIPSVVAVKSCPASLRLLTISHLVSLRCPTAVSAASKVFTVLLSSSNRSFTNFSLIFFILILSPLDSFLIYFNIGYYTEVRLQCQAKNAFILKYFGGLTGTLRCSMGYRCLGVGGWPLRPSEDTQKSCGER